MNRTYTAKPSTIERKWYVVDAAGLAVGRVAAAVAKVLRGKHKPTFCYHIDCGDYVVVVNAAKAVLTGRKGDELIHWHSGYPGGLKNISREKMLAEKPEETMRRAIKGMLPKGALGADMLEKLKVYSGAEHPHAAQAPVPLKVGK